MKAKIATNYEPAQEGKVFLSGSARLVILAVYIIGLLSLSYWATGQVVPRADVASLWFLAAAAYVSFSLLSAPFFSRPDDTLASGIASAILLWSADLPPGVPARHTVEVIQYSGLTLALVTVAVSGIGIITRRLPSTRNPTIAKMAFRVSRRMGNPAVLFTPAAVVGAHVLVETDMARASTLVAVWVVLVTVRPLELFWLSWLASGLGRWDENSESVLGRIIRIDSPNLVRVELLPGAKWGREEVGAAHFADGSGGWVLPLFKQVRDGRVIGTGLRIPNPNSPDVRQERDTIYLSPAAPTRQELIASLAHSEVDAELAGFVVEGSTISQIRFEIAAGHSLEEGTLVFCRERDNTVFYQVIDARTDEETFGQNPWGTHIVSATQLGIVERERGFARFNWLPSMNAPVLQAIGAVGSDAETPPEGTFRLGVVPGTRIPVYARMDRLHELHTAVLGATGTGKTEVALDLVRRAVGEGMRVICVDFTGEYRPRLQDLGPRELKISSTASERLSDIVERIETGEYRGSSERQELRSLIEKVRPGVVAQLEEFLENENGGVSILELPDIANTRASLRLTELFLTAVFGWARRNRRLRRILLVLEEAHTIVPETNMFGYDYGETQTVVGRIAQIALQGRKYGVGLLLISQRTALVSKTLLSQCNSVISFALVDKTSLSYLESVFSPEHVGAVPNLPRLHAVVYGAGVLSERPILLEIPYDETKKRASDALRKVVEPVREATPQEARAAQGALEDAVDDDNQPS